MTEDTLTRALRESKELQRQRSGEGVNGPHRRLVLGDRFRDALEVAVGRLEGMAEEGDDIMAGWAIKVLAEIRRIAEGEKSE